MNEKQIELLKNEIDFLERKMNEADELHDSLYRNHYEEIRNVFMKSYEIRKVKEELEKKLELYQMLTEKGIDTNKKYYLVDDIYLSVSDLRPYFYIEDGCSGIGGLYPASARPHWLHLLLCPQRQRFLPKPRRSGC